VRWSTVLPKWGETEQRISTGLDYRAFKNEVLFAGQNQVPDITIHPLHLTYSAVHRMTAAELSAYVTGVTNIPGGNDGQQEDFTRSRAGASANYVLFRYGLNYTRQFRNEWQMRVAFNGQHTGDALVSGEQFGIGGPDTVRGYLVREVTNDKGFSTQLELFTPDVAKRLGLSDSYKLRLVGFYDWGSVSRNNAQPGEVQQDGIASMGLGLRLGYGKSVSLRLDLAQILQETVNRDNNSQRLTGSLAIVF
jgi:hemolysin activation/secretion protein